MYNGDTPQRKTPMPITKTRSIKGRYRRDGGELSGIQLLHVHEFLERDGSTSWRDAEGGFELWAERYEVTTDSNGWQIVGDCAWAFLPEDETVIPRIGFTIRDGRTEH
jgi:hypothetical protein